MTSDQLRWTACQVIQVLLPYSHLPEMNAVALSSRHHRLTIHHTFHKSSGSSCEQHQAFHVRLVISHREDRDGVRGPCQPGPAFPSESTIGLMLVTRLSVCADRHHRCRPMLLSLTNASTTRAARLSLVDDVIPSHGFSMAQTH